MLAVDDVLGDAGPAEHVDLAADAGFGKLLLPILRPRGERTVFIHSQALDHRDDGNLRRDILQNLLEEPLGTVRGYASDDEVRSGDRLFPVLELIESDAGGEGTREFGVPAGSDALVYDLPVIGSSDDLQGYPVLRKGEDEG